MRILFIGDVFASTGRRVLADQLKTVKKNFGVDFCIANGENSAGGRGLTTKIAKKFFKYGVNIITGGNHSMSTPEIFSDARYNRRVLRPENLMSETRGTGHTIFQLENGMSIGVINLMGRTFFKESLNCPFETADKLIENLRTEANIVIVDFHAEATSEKICLAHHLTGKVSAVLGTHTHVQTADERILKDTTAFITDAGMTGPENSAIGMKENPIINKYLGKQHKRFEPSKSGPMFNGVIIDIDDKTGKATHIERILKRVDFNESNTSTTQ